MKLELNEKQIQDLIRLVHIGDSVINGRELNDQYTDNSSNLVQYILSTLSKLEVENIYYDWDLEFYDIDPKMEDELKTIIEEYDEYRFKEELVTRLTERDLYKETRNLNYDNDGLHKRRQELEMLYKQEIERNDLKNLYVLRISKA